MMKVLLYTIAFGLFIHGLIHLMGFISYWQLTEIEELPYKTTLLNGRWDVGEIGIQFFGLLWLLSTIGFMVGILALLAQHSWWLPMLFIITIVSLSLTILDWGVAFRGAIINIVILLGLAIPLGLRMMPSPFPLYPEQTLISSTVSIPDNLPPPVARFYQTIAGDVIPIVETAVITGQVNLRFGGLTFPSRLRFTHDAGQGYRHYIEAAIFGLPILTVDESYLDGNARLELPFGIVENEPKIDRAANLALWGEALWFPSLYLTDTRVEWEAVDDTTARLIVPFGDSEEIFTLTFDEESGMLTELEALRWRDASDEARIGWTIEPLSWTTFNGILLPSQASVTWADEETPWLVMTILDVTYNADITHYIRASGL